MWCLWMRSTMSAAAVSSSMWEAHNNFVEVWSSCTPLAAHAGAVQLLADFMLVFSLRSQSSLVCTSLVPSQLFDQHQHVFLVLVCVRFQFLSPASCACWRKSDTEQFETSGVETDGQVLSRLRRSRALPRQHESPDELSLFGLRRETAQISAIVHRKCF